MNDIELQALEEVRQEVLSALREKYGEDRVQQVDDLNPAITSRMMLGERFDGLEEWMYDIVDDFHNMIVNHPRVIIPVH